MDARALVCAHVGPGARCPRPSRISASSPPSSPSSSSSASTKPSRACWPSAAGDGGPDGVGAVPASISMPDAQRLGRGDVPAVGEQRGHEARRAHDVTWTTNLRSGGRSAAVSACAPVVGEPRPACVLTPCPISCRRRSPAGCQTAGWRSGARVRGTERVLGIRTGIARHDPEQPDPCSRPAGACSKQRDAIFAPRCGRVMRARSMKRCRHSRSSASGSVSAGATTPIAPSGSTSPCAIELAAFAGFQHETNSFVATPT